MPRAIRVAFHTDLIWTVGQLVNVYDEKSFSHSHGIVSNFKNQEKTYRFWLVRW